MVRSGRRKLRGRAWGDKPVEPSDSRRRRLCCCYHVGLAKVGTEVQSLQRQPTSPMACERDTGTRALRGCRRCGTGEQVTLPSDKKESKGLVGQRVVWSATGVGMFSAVRVALSGVAGDGVDVGICNAEAEVQGKSRTIDRRVDRSRQRNATQCSTVRYSTVGATRDVDVDLTSPHKSFWLLDPEVDGLTCGRRSAEACGYKGYIPLPTLLARSQAASMSP